MKKLLILSSSLLILTACSGQKDKATKTETPIKPAMAQTISENERLDQWFQTVFERHIAKSPETLTYLGRKTDNDKWDDDSKIAYLDQLDEVRADLEYMKANFDLSKLDEGHKLSYRLAEYNANNQLEGARWWGYRYRFNQMQGVQTGIPTLLINPHRIDTIDDAKAYIARLNGIRKKMAQNIKVSHDSAERGIQPPKFVYDHVIRDTQNVISGEPFDDGDLSTLLADFKGKIDKLDISDEQRKSLYSQAIKALLKSVKPAYDDLIAEMQAQQKTATTDDGVWKLPDGKEYYKYRLKLMTSTDMSAQEIHELGLSEVARIHGEMREIMKKVGFEGTLQEFFTYLKTDPKFVYEDSEAGRAAYMKRAEEIIDTMKTRLDDVFIKKPKADLIVKRVEPFREKSAGKAFYNQPSADGKRPGMYYANLYKITDMPKYQMEALAYHEGIPGHHMQISLQQEMQGLPMFRKFGRVTAYSEGWGLYSEYLPKEMGFYQDPYSDFGRLAMELWRAARLVVDTGIHDQKWTREQAIKYLTDNTPNPENDCVKAIERYIVMPGQATAYKIGMNKIIELRELAKSELGDKFDIREYHDVILSSGPVPLAIMEERVKDWIKSKA
ncbi:MAG TPA: DUF885 domain-containing protein [Hellea balneolensis]|uniref:DUF885 domain-containing protein n=1 Tax=Hellea balneolensis TaxID=287478 RepID=A0A7C5LXG6_9PROT|nr:DUF885 domain-containing protein [Hellea balneolensis]